MQVFDETKFHDASDKESTANEAKYHDATFLKNLYHVQVLCRFTTFIYTVIMSFIKIENTFIGKFKNVLFVFRGTSLEPEWTQQSPA